MSFATLPVWVRLQCAVVTAVGLLALVIAPMMRPALPVMLGVAAAPLVLGKLGSGRFESWVSEMRLELGDRPPEAGPGPGRPAILDAPSLILPTFVPPKPALPGRPEEHLPGQWNRCNVCGRQLTDPTSRWRGIGPDCFARRGIHWPQGPINPAFRAWEREVERLREGFLPVVMEAKTRHEERLDVLLAEHVISMRLWESRLEERRVIQAKHERSVARWSTECQRRTAERAAWESDPRQRTLATAERIRVGMWPLAAACSIGGTWIWLASQ